MLLFNLLKIIDNFYWQKIGFVVTIIFGIYFTFKTRFFQFRSLLNFHKVLYEISKSDSFCKNGIHPIKLYFSSVGGMIGLGNIIGISSAIAIGGPGALFWLWIASFCGMLIKYSEVYLGVFYRIPNNKNGFDGGPMFYLGKAFKNPIIPIIVSFLICIYGVEVYQFLIITDILSESFKIKKIYTSLLLLLIIIYVAKGGIRRLSSICTYLMPVFLIGYIVACFIIIFKNINYIPEVFKLVIVSAFKGHAPIGGFLGSTIITAIQYGTSRAVYSGDIGIGYDSIIQSETKTKNPMNQAKLAIFSLLTDSLICTLTILVILLTDVWFLKNINSSEYIIIAFSKYFPNIKIFMNFFLFLAGFSTIIAFFTVGLKSASFISNRFGSRIYLFYSVFAFLFFSFFDQTEVILVMSVSGGFLMLLNLVGIFRLRNKINFS